MIKIFTILFAIIAMIYSFNWLASFSGEVLFILGDYEVKISPLFFIISSVAIIVLSILLWLSFSYIYQLPRKIQLIKEARSNEKVQNAIMKGLVHASAGNINAAEIEIKKIDRIKKNTSDIMVLLLKAQNASLKKDNVALNKIFQQMGKIETTKMLSYRGLYTLSKNSKNPQKSIELLKDAETYNSAEPWVIDELLKCYLVTQNWKSASEVLDKMLAHKLISRKKYNLHKSIILTSHALLLEEQNPSEALSLALDAIKLNKSQIIAVITAARILSEQGERARAEKIITDTWKSIQHEDLAYLLSYVNPGASPKQRVEKIEGLIKKTKISGIEGDVALCRAYIDVKNFDKAKQVIEKYINENTSRRIYELLAEIDSHLFKGNAKSRDWMRKAMNARYDTNWSADDFSSDVWLPCIPDTGEIKSFEWGDHRIKTLDIDNNYISNFMRSKMLQGNRLSQELQENNVEDDIIEVTEIVEEKDSKIKSGKADKKNKEIKETAISEEIAVPDDPGVIQEEDIHEP